MIKKLTKTKSKIKSKTSSKKVSKRKGSKKIAKRSTRRNPDDIITHVSNGELYVNLSDFIREFIKDIQKRGDDRYYNYGYEIENILKYAIRNSNNVGTGLHYLISITQFKNYMTKGLEHRFLDAGNYVDVLVSFEKTLAKIPTNIKFIDLGN